jgi:hypothetical protein
MGDEFTSIRQIEKLICNLTGRRCTGSIGIADAKAEARDGAKKGH